MKTRFAPTPSGYLHLGNVFNLLLAERWRDRTGGRLLLRIDDLDRGRTRPEYVEDIFRVASWLGVAFDEGPTDPHDFGANWTQARRAGRYAEALQRLAEGGRVFACTCSRHDVDAATRDGGYPGTCRNRGLDLETPGAAWRLRLDGREVEGPSEPALRDPVVRRRDGTCAYHVATIVDDLDYGVSHVFRGMDLEPSTRLQRAIAPVLGLDAYLDVRFEHHPLLTDDAGGKLSKSAGARAMSLFDDPDLAPDAVRNAFDRWMARSEEPARP